MFNLFSIFISLVRSKSDLPDDESIIDHAKPIAHFSVGSQNLAVYRTKTRLLITAAETPWLTEGWMPLGTKLPALIAATRMKFDGFSLGWDSHEAMQEAAWRQARGEA